jgi:hypothetical protein
MIIATNETEVEPVPGRAGANLGTLANEINEAHRECEQAAQSAVTHAVRCGELLLQGKSAIPHGEWLPWLAANCECSDRTARLYMRIARELPKLEPGKRQHVADLPLREAIQAIRLPRLKIDPEFSTLLPPLTTEEREGLEADILRDGCKDPIVCWHGIILDGHERYRICRKYNIPFDTHDLYLDGESIGELRLLAKCFVYRTQLQRRNLSPDQKRELRDDKRHPAAAARRRLEASV